MKRFLFAGLVLLMLAIAGPLQAQETEESSLGYITRYAAIPEQSLTYGIFELGSKASVRLVTPVDNGKLRFRLHARHYVVPINRPFRVWVTFEDVTGRVFQQSKKIAFDDVHATMTPVWFEGLDGLVGYYGDQKVEIAIPKGTSVINFLGEYDGVSSSPNQLLGYISHIEVPTQEPLK